MCITQCKKLNKIVILFILHQYKFHRLVAYVLGPVLNTLLGTKFHLRNAENFVEDGSIIVANHQSVLDFQGMITIWPIMKRCSAIAKKEINYAGPFGFVAWLCGTIFIQRKDPKKAVSSMNEAGDIVKQKKVLIWSLNVLSLFYRLITYFASVVEAVDFPRGNSWQWGRNAAL